MFVSAARWSLVVMTFSVLDCVHRAPQQDGLHSSEERRTYSKGRSKDAIRLRWESALEASGSRVTADLTMLKQDANNYCLRASWGPRRERVFFRRQDTLIEIWPDLRKYRETQITSWRDISARVDSLPRHFSQAHPLSVTEEIAQKMFQTSSAGGGTGQLLTVEGWTQPVLADMRAILKDESGSVTFSLRLREAELIDAEQIAPSLKGYEKVTEIPSYAPWWK